MKIFQTSSLFETNKFHHGGPPCSGGPGAIVPVAPPLNPALNHSQTELGHVLHCRLFFLLVATFLIISFSVFYFLYIYICGPDVFHQIFFPVGFQSHSRRSNEKRRGCNSGILPLQM